MRRSIMQLLLFFVCVTAFAQYSILSPDGTVTVQLNTYRTTLYRSKFTSPYRRTLSVSFDKKNVVTKKDIGVTIKSEGRRYSFGRSEIASSVYRRNCIDSTGMSEPCLSCMQGQYNSVVLQTKDGINLELRAYNNGVAYKFTVEGRESDYKILEVSAPLPHEHPAAILGTYEGEHSLHWRFMTKEQCEDDEEYIKREYPRGQIVSWQDALATVTGGVHSSWLCGNLWRNTGEIFSYSADVTYKYLFGGLSFSPSQQILYIYKEDAYFPFEHNIGGVRSWDISTKFGFSLPIQYGYTIVNVIPYVSGTMMHLHQRGNVVPGYKALDHHNHYLAGPGIKLQMVSHDRLVAGISYDYQFFTDSKAPLAKSSLGFSLGYLY